MEISTRNLRALPDVAGLKRLLQSIAMLDAILMPDWEYRYYSFNAHWSDTEMMGSMRNGAGDEFFALFNGHGAFMKGFVHDSPAAAAKISSDAFYRDLPSEFEDGRREPAFSPDDVTFCIWRLNQQLTWSCGKVDLPVADDADGSASLLSILDGVPDSYRGWASAYYEQDLPIAPIEAVYRHQPLTEELVTRLNPQQRLHQLGEDIAEIGYPA
jgi:hypothetical protein